MGSCRGYRLVCLDAHRFTMGEAYLANITSSARSTSIQNFETAQRKAA